MVTEHHDRWQNVDCISCNLIMRMTQDSWVVSFSLPSAANLVKLCAKKEY